jgi:hypothetical protein
MKWRFVRSPNVRTGGPRCRGRQKRRPVSGWMRALTCHTLGRRMAPSSTEVSLGGAAPFPCMPSGAGAPSARALVPPAAGRHRPTAAGSSRACGGFAHCQPGCHRLATAAAAPGGPAVPCWGIYPVTDASSPLRPGTGTTALAARPAAHTAAEAPMSGPGLKDLVWILAWVALVVVGVGRGLCRSRGRCSA